MEDGLWLGPQDWPVARAEPQALPVKADAIFEGIKLAI